MPLFARPHHKAAPELAPEEVSALVAELDRLVDGEQQRLLEHQARLPAHQAQPVVDALVEVHDRAATAALVRAAATLVVGDAPLTLLLLDALAREGSAPAVEGLVDLALGRWAGVRARAATVLVARQSQAALPVVAGRLATGDDAVQERAVALLARLGDAGAVPLLVPVLCDPAAGVRERAAQALGELGDAIAVPALLVAEETDRLLRRGGVSSLTWRGQLSPYLLAVAALTGEGDLTVGLAQHPGYDAEEQLERLVAPARRTAGAEVASAVAALPAAASPPWTGERLAGLLLRSGVVRRGAELSYADVGRLALDVERCRHLGLVVEQTPAGAIVACLDEALPLRLERGP